MLNDSSETIKYFQRKAADYDRVDEQIYWRLSDQLLWEQLDGHVFSKLRSGFKFLDAGAGTGRWSERILCSYPDACAVLRDISPDMLAQAEKKALRFGARMALSWGDIDQMPEFQSGSFNLVFNFHNVLGFVKDPLFSLCELARVLRKGGYLVTLAPNKFHMGYFNILLGRLKTAQAAIEMSAGTFTDDMPKIHVFTPAGLEELYNNAGVDPLYVSGFPSLIYPAFAETQIEGNTVGILDLLRDKPGFDCILGIERQLLGDRDAAGRGNNLMIIGKKR